MSIEILMESVANALPNKTRRGSETIREVCITRYEDGGWVAMAGGHSAVHIGEYGGDFVGEGDTAEAAIRKCLDRITQGHWS